VALDVLLVTRLDRLASSTRDLLIVAEQPGRVGVESLHPIRTAARISSHD
jgi:hypothetical protein